MNQKFAPLLVLLALISACSSSPTANIPATKSSERYVSTIRSRGLDYDKTLARVAFGSCANQDQPQPLWSTISSTQPDLFVFMGDNVYASAPHQQPIAAQYKKLDQIPEYLKIRAEVPFLATWDDHDFGQRDGGADFTGKHSAQVDFLNYWSYMRSSIPPEQSGVYHAKIIGPKKKAVQFIMLDTRYFRAPLLARSEMEGKPKNYLPSEETVLGEAQWAWLEEQLQRPADLRFIISSIQLIPDTPLFEKWGNFPKDRQRFFSLLERLNIRNAIILSGDRHIGSISKMDRPRLGPLYEVTASSINRPSRFSDADPHYVGTPYSAENFGIADIDWKKKIVTLELRGMENQVVNKVVVKLPK